MASRTFERKPSEASERCGSEFNEGEVEKQILCSSVRDLWLCTNNLNGVEMLSLWTFEVFFALVLNYVLFLAHGRSSATETPLALAFNRNVSRWQ